MRIVIDMQGAQTESRFRGIGRYTMAFAQAVARNRGEHEIVLALNGLFPETIEPIRAAFEGLLPQENLRVWSAPRPVKHNQPGNRIRIEIAELLRESFLAGLQPDVIHIPSVFEGYLDDAVVSIGRFDQITLISVTTHDLIPLLRPDHYLTPNPNFSAYYWRKLDSLKKASLFLAISESAKSETLEHLLVDETKVINTYEGVEAHFRILDWDARTEQAFLEKLAIMKPFLLYTGGADERKNLPRLIQAYSSLGKELREQHQLVLAGKMPDGEVARLESIASDYGVRKNELVFTGYINDDDLVALYNICKLYVFPSWHEGFGLPALEAMACGAPVIGANTTSLPEVIGLDEALFDPFNAASIAAKIEVGLTDDKFRQRLRGHAQQHVKKFSWDIVAQHSIGAWQVHLKSTASKRHTRDKLEPERDRLFNALIPHLVDADDDLLKCVAVNLAKNESSSLERQLLVDVSELCQHDAGTGVQRVVRSYLFHLLRNPPQGFCVQPVYATLTTGYRYARACTEGVVGQKCLAVTDSPIHWQRGDLFFGLDMQHHVQLAQAAFFQQMKNEGVVVKFLVYDLLPIQFADLFKDSNAKELHEKWLAMVASTGSAICISKATADALEVWVAEHAIPQSSAFDIAWVHIGADIDGSRPSGGLPPETQAVLEGLRKRPTFLCVSTIEPRKRQQQIFEAVEQLWKEGEDVNLVFVGQQGWKVEALSTLLRKHPEAGKRLYWLEGISDEYLNKVYAASTCLIAASVNEGFGLSLIEAAQHGVPIIARDIPVFREVAGEHAFYFQGETAKDLTEALYAWLEKYRAGKHLLSTGVPWLTWQQSTEKLKKALVERVCPRRQLLVDISELVQRDVGTGIQRVVRNILKEWLHNPPQGYRVEPVYATVDQPYRYARGFTTKFLGIPENVLWDEPIDYATGDIFLGLDLQPGVAYAQRAFYQTLRRQGVKVEFVVYDLLCVLMPEYFVPGAADGFTPWLEVVAESDGVVCISQAVARDVGEWVSKNGPVRQRPFNIDWFHLGAEFDYSHSTQGLPQDAKTTLAQLHSRPTFLMVGTIEPRKGHTQVLDAFEQLWQSEVDVNLVIVGKQGWVVEQLIERLGAHHKRVHLLFWLEGISDEYLEKLYAVSTCLIAASYGEGFGLPLIEAAQHKLPIIARDIPVFREVAGDHAYYFDAENSDDLAVAIKNWLELYEKGNHPASDKMPWLTWKESAAQLLNLLIGDSEHNATLDTEISLKRERDLTHQT